jgi:hypothetical protein
LIEYQQNVTTEEVNEAPRRLYEQGRRNVIGWVMRRAGATKSAFYKLGGQKLFQSERHSFCIDQACLFFLLFV